MLDVGQDAIAVLSCLLFQIVREASIILTSGSIRGFLVQTAFLSCIDFTPIQSYLVSKLLETLFFSSALLCNKTDIHFQM